MRVFSFVVVVIFLRMSIKKSLRKLALLNLASLNLAYHRINNVLPDTILIFRDGIGTGQLETAAKHEVRQLRDCFQEIKGNQYMFFSSFFPSQARESQGKVLHVIQSCHQELFNIKY